jgi:hypothetical protein
MTGWVKRGVDVRSEPEGTGPSLIYRNPAGVAQYPEHRGLRAVHPALAGQVVGELAMAQVGRSFSVLSSGGQDLVTLGLHQPVWRAPSHRRQVGQIVPGEVWRGPSSADRSDARGNRRPWGPPEPFSQPGWIPSPRRCVLSPPIAGGASGPGGSPHRPAPR